LSPIITREPIIVPAAMLLGIVMPSIEFVGKFVALSLQVTSMSLETARALFGVQFVAAWQIEAL